MEEEVYTSARDLQTILENIGDGLVVVDENYTIVYANPKACEHYNLTLQEMLGRRCYQIFHKSDEPCDVDLCSVKIVFSEGRAFSDIHIHKKNGDEIYIEFIASPIRDEKGRVRYAVITFRDVTEAKKAAREVERLKELNEKILLLSPVGIGVFDREGNVVFANPKLVEICGAKTREEIEGCNVFDAEPLVKTSFSEKIMEVVEEGKEMYLKNFEMETPHGRQIIADIHLIPMKSDGKVENVLLIINDLTEIVKAKREMEESNEVLRRALDELDSAYRELSLLREIDEALNRTLDLDEVLHIIVRGIVEVLGYDSCAIHLLSDDGNYLINKDYIIDSKIVQKLESLTGLKIKNYRIPVYEGSMFYKIIKEKKPIITTDIEQAVKSHTLDKKIWKIAKIIAKISGVKSGIGVPLVAQGKVLGVIGVASKDILTQEDVERLQKYANQTALAVLQAKMYEELKIAKEKVEAAYQELKEIDRLKTDIINNVSHELKTPIAIATLALEQLAEEKDEKERKVLINMAMRALERQQNIIDSLIDFAKSKSGEYSLVFQRVNIAEVVDKALLLKMEDALSKNIKIITNLKNVEVEVDPVRLETALVNIIDNAIKFNRIGGEIKIEVEKINGNVEVSISDTGIGFKKSEVDKIFEPLTQLDSRASREFSGTGMGLAVAKRIVEAHGGRIVAESQPKVGSTFTIILPVSQRR